MLNLNSGKIGVCILSAGIARRLEPISKLIAKPAFPLGGKIPISELWVRRFVKAGISNIAMNLYSVPESIQSYFGDGSEFGANITYVHEQEPSGTLGGAIKMVRALQKKGVQLERVFIPSGDIVSGIGTEELQDMLDGHIKHGGVFTMMLAPIPWERRADFGTAILEGFKPNESIPARVYSRITDFVEKSPDSPSNENNASNYLIETSLLLELEPYLTKAQLGVESPCYDFGKHVIMGMMGKVPHMDFLKKYGKKLYGYEPGKPWYDIGNKRDYLQVNSGVLEGKIKLELSYKKESWGWIGKNVSTDLGQIRINPPVIIGNNCVIEPGVQIGPFVTLGDGWVVRRDASIKDCVLWPYYNYTDQDETREIRERVTIENSIITGGVISCDIKEGTVIPKSDGSLETKSLDWIPEGKRP